MSNSNQLRQIFTAKAEAVSAIVAPVAGFQEALAYTLDVCERKEACQLLASGCEASLSPSAEALCDTKQQKVIAAPGLAQAQLDELKKEAAAKSIRVIDSDLRGHLAGIDIGFTFADYGIAETGTLVLDSSSEEIRLTTMVSEVHVALLPVSKILATAFDLEADLQKLMQISPNYTAFITGASRTADIERVLALGVHGPLELHILLLEA